jgi:hypothetical protein
MKTFLIRSTGFFAVLLGGTFVSPVLFLVLLGIVLGVMYSATLEVVLAALYVELLSGIPQGSVSLPLALACVAAEAIRPKISEKFPHSFTVIFIMSLAVFITAHMVILTTL